MSGKPVQQQAIPRKSSVFSLLKAKRILYIESYQDCYLMLLSNICANVLTNSFEKC